MKHIYARVEKLHDVGGRISYTNAPTSDKKQENVYATFDTADSKFWRELANYNQKEYQKTSNASNSKAKCCEAREIVLAIPNKLFGANYERLAELIATDFKKRHGVECNVALHLNERKTNYHAHIIFAERKVIEAEPKIATRNTFFDERGRKVRTKKEILNEDGTIRDGCSIVKKGEVLSAGKTFSSKNSYFKSKQFTRDTKERYASVWNRILKEDKYKVFDHDDIYIATKKIHKSYTSEIKERMEQENKIIIEYNNTAEKIVKSDETRKDELVEQKRTILQDSYDTSKATGTNFSDVFYRKVKRAVIYMQNLYQTLTRAVDKIRTTGFDYSQSVRDRIKQAEKMAKEYNDNRYTKEDEHEYEHDDDLELGM